VRDAILDTAAALVADQGLLSVTMSQIAEGTGIGRATLYKYFPDVESVLLAWHERQVGDHLAQLAGIGDQPGAAAERLAAVLRAYGHIRHRSSRHHPSELAAFLHRDPQIGRAQQQILELVRGLLARVAAAGGIRDDITTDELASYCLHAMTAAGELESEAAIDRLVGLTMDALRPPR
jgi:AcrR family transcriptional regulator